MWFAFSLLGIDAFFEARKLSVTGWRLDCLKGSGLIELWIVNCYISIALAGR
jgi:hypothetical protein